MDFDADMVFKDPAPIFPGIVNCPDHGENSQLGSAQQQQQQQNPETESQQQQLPEDQSQQQQDSAKEESARQDNKQGQGEEDTEESSCKHENTGINNLIFLENECRRVNFVDCIINVKRVV